MKERKRIALLTSQLEENYQKQFIEGFFSKAFEDDFDVCVFAPFRKEPDSEAKAVGGNNIFNLINYDMFDAVVVLPDRLRVSGLMMKIEKDLKTKFKGTVLFVDKESKDYPYTMMDHYEPIMRLMDHLIEDHKYKDIAFITGYKWHPHSKQRLQAYIDCMDKNNLTIEKNRIFYGDYWYDGGTLAVEQLISKKDKMPEVIACANDYMAIGVAGALTKHGYKIPEDIAVVGYDSVEEGRLSPSPITSVPLPTKPFGVHAVNCVKALLDGKPLPKFNYVEPIFYGSSCGCHSQSINPELGIRENWTNAQTGQNYFARFNSLTEDLILQTNFRDIVDMMQTYSYQIREFDSFYICMNEVWANEEIPIMDTEMKKGYAKKMAPILVCGPSGKGEDVIDYSKRFDSSVMLPALEEDKDEPKAYIFSPMCFNDVCFGYSVISYGSEAKSYDDSYYMWMKSVMTAIECYRRNTMSLYTNRQNSEGVIYDSLTGMFNYSGFIKHAKPMIERSKEDSLYITVLAIDIYGLGKINASFGRKEGDAAILELSKIVYACVDEGAMCCRLGNDEIVIAELSKYADQRVIHGVRKKIDKMLEERNNNTTAKFKIKLFTGSCTGRVDGLSKMEDLVNATVSRKNGNKANELRMRNNKILNDNEQSRVELVKKILDENLLSYHFQPIVRAKDGSIFAYEALMRAQTEQKISPLEIIKYATHLDRLEDIERATFFNILGIVEENMKSFSGKKVFINSIPGKQVSGDEAVELESKLEKLKNYIVVELTEQTEANDKELEDMKDEYSRIGVQTAVDDYGTGYSNIVNLLRYMPNYVKIDRMLLSGIQDNLQKQHFVKDIVLFAHENHFKVLAEGIETSEELETVIKLDVDYIQGYYTARPNPEILNEIMEEIKDEIKKYNLSQNDEDKL